MTRRLLIALATGSLVSPVSYGAECDLNEVDDAAVAGGSLSTVTSASAAFTSGDTGKTFTLAAQGGAVTTGTLTYVNSTTATMSVAAGGSMSAARLIWFTNDVTAWQDALNAALPGQTVTIADPNFRSGIAGQLTVPDNVTLGSFGLGPFEPVTNPCRTTYGPTLAFVQDATTAAITLGNGSGLGDLILYGANQVHRAYSTPLAKAAMVYIPGTSSTGTAGCHIGRPLLCNAYDGVRIHGGRHQIDTIYVGALHRGVILDESQDTIDIGRIQAHVYWRLCEGAAAAGGTLDDYAKANAWALEVNRADAFHVGYVFSLNYYGTVLMTDSPDTGLANRAGYGVIDHVEADGVAAGIYVVSANLLQVHSCNIGAGSAGDRGIATAAGGTVAPVVLISSMYVHGTFANGNVTNGAGTLLYPAANPGR